jgi:hypothetical protein
MVAALRQQFPEGAAKPIRALREAGLVDVAAAGSFPVGGAVCDRLEVASMRHVRAELIAAGLADNADIDAHVTAVAAGELDLTLAPLISAWGRRAETGRA